MKEYCVLMYCLIYFLLELYARIISPSIEYVGLYVIKSSSYLRYNLLFFHHISIKIKLFLSPKRYALADKI